jgi:hypothetical protein
MAIHLENDDKPVDLAVLYQIIRQTYLARLILPRQLWNEETTLELTNNIQPNDTTWYNMIYIIIIHNHTWWTSWYSVRRNFKPNQGKTSPNIIMTSSTNITPYSPGIKHGLPKKKNHLVDSVIAMFGDNPRCLWGIFPALDRPRRFSARTRSISCWT